MCGESKPDLPSGAFIPNSLAYTVCANGSVFGHLGIDQAILDPQHCPATPHSREAGLFTCFLGGHGVVGDSQNHVLGRCVPGPQSLGSMQ